MDKYKELHNLRDKMDMDVSLPLKTNETKLVFGYGNTNAKILVIGEAPGATENFQGLPFVGQAGKLLDKLLPLANLKRKNIFITNIVHHRPPSNRDPEPSEISAYGVYLDEIIKIIDPEVIITLGRFSMAKFLPNVFISSVHGEKHEVLWEDKKIVVFPMYHPAASLRNGNILRQEQKDFIHMGELLPEILKPKNDKVSVTQEILV